ncbi:hypothetical protein OKA04_05490 [Luteolibacter flavescens]|uniref:Uncharacterized protein n=1 Tax=Luteolibacter flavescens TaxID=1859460 RepID=A0ABT3FLF2_9BACT|nr:hypothetical protein [Luteolibacter flavescens]MCW1884174.1 hypothetical protein [Luteolibacter flavescens]
MEERPDHPSEPTEDELRSMLEEREEVQAAEQNRLGSKVTRVSLVIFAVAAITFFSFRENREAVADIFREPDPEPLHLPGLADFPEDDGSVESQLLRNASGIDPSALGAPGGKIVTKEDIEFASELLNFGTLPKKHDETPPQEKEKKKPED